MKRSLVLLLAAAILITACGTRLASPSPELYADNKSLGYGGGEPVMAEAPMGAPVASRDMANNAPADYYAQPQERLVIQNVDMSIIVTSPKDKMTAIGAMASRLGGYVVSSNLYQTYLHNGLTAPEASIVIRVPAEKLEEALAEIKKGVGETPTETRNGQDVTQAYTDQKSRLRNLEAAEKQLQVIMDKAEKTEDVINVFNQLVYYREQIEMVKGQIQYYEQSAALSAISIVIRSEETVQPLEIGKWKPQGVARDAAQALIDFLQGFANFLIWLSIFILPMFVVVVLPLWLVWLVVRRLRKGNVKNKKVAPPEM